MRTDIRDVSFIAASDIERATGLLGWARFSLAGLVINGVAVRRKRDGEMTLSWPERRDRLGREHAIVRPQDDRSRRLLESGIFHALGIEETTP